MPLGELWNIFDEPFAEEIHFSKDKALQNIAHTPQPILTPQTEVNNMQSTDADFFGSLGGLFGSAAAGATSFFDSLTDVSAAHNRFETTRDNGHVQTSSIDQKTLLMVGGLIALVLILK